MPRTDSALRHTPPPSAGHEYDTAPAGRHERVRDRPGPRQSSAPGGSPRPPDRRNHISERVTGSRSMDQHEWLAGQFEANRKRLPAVAYRMLGFLREEADADEARRVRM